MSSHTRSAMIVRVNDKDDHHLVGAHSRQRMFAIVAIGELTWPPNRSSHVVVNNNALTSELPASQVRPRPAGQTAEANGYMADEKKIKINCSYCMHGMSKLSRTTISHF
jgi:hypothetical protein